MKRRFLIQATTIPIFSIILFFLQLIPLKTVAQIEKLIVETYYVADANDATDTTEGRSLQTGMKTYRIYLDLAPESRLRKIFGSDIHPLRFTSTTDFYNNIDRPNAYFGYLINKSWYTNNPTLALDSWLTIGLTSTQYVGVPKDEDTDGSFIGGPNNNGGSSGIPGGILTNTDPLAGIPVTNADGYVPNTNVLGQWFDQGFRDAFNDDTTVFGSINTGNEFLSYNAILQQASGIEGADTDSNKILVAQLTTLGDISFELNIVIDEFNGTSYNEVTYVANGDSLLAGEIVSPALTYPPVCGCTDPAFLEYSSAFACSELDSCQTLAVIGCMDPMACNYDASANISLPAMCCYPGLCDDRNLTVVCPSIEVSRFGIKNLFPNPATNQIVIQLGNFNNQVSYYHIYDAVGRIVKEEHLGVISGIIDVTIDVSSMCGGLYQIIINNGTETDRKIFFITD